MDSAWFNEYADLITNMRHDVPSLINETRGMWNKRYNQYGVSNKYLNSSYKASGELMCLVSQILSETLHGNSNDVS